MVIPYTLLYYIIQVFTDLFACFALLLYICTQTKKKRRLNMEAATLQSTPFTPFQIEMLELISRVTSEAEMKDIRRLLGQYFAKQAEDAIDRLWDEGKLNDDVIEEWKNEHMRTPYKQWWTSFSTLTVCWCRSRVAAVTIPSDYHLHLITADPDDDKFVDCAFKANAKYIVTQDHHYDVLRQTPFPKIEIIDIDEFLSIL